MRKFTTTIAAGILAGAALFTSALSASAAPQDPAAHRQGASYIPNTKGAVTNWHLGKGTVYGDNLGPGMVDWFTTVYNGSVHEVGLDADLKKRMTFGSGFRVLVPATPIQKIGGSHAANATELTEFMLPEGIWQITTSAVFDRVNQGADGYVAPTTDTMPQLVVRTADEENGGTIMGAAISRAGFTELTGSSVATLMVDGPDKVVKVRAFGYNEDRSSFGSKTETEAPQFTAGAQIVAVRIG